MSGEYHLPRAVVDRLETALRGRKNATATITLATFLARFWSAPGRLLMAFPIDRRALAEHAALGLTEARVRGALAVLVEVGFLTRCEPEAGKRYQRTEGGLQRRAILHRFGEEYGVAFGKANARAQAKRGTPAPARRPANVPTRHTAEIVNVPGRNLANLVPTGSRDPQLAQKQAIGGSHLIMGEEKRSASLPTVNKSNADSSSPLEAALARWARAIGG